MIHYQPFYLCRSHGYGLRSDLITKVHFVRKHPTCLEPKGAETNGCLICFRVCSKGFHAIKPEKSAPKHVPTLLCPHSKRYQLTHVFVIRKVLVSAFVWVHQCSSWYLEPYTPWFNRPLSCFFVSRLDRSYLGASLNTFSRSSFLICFTIKSILHLHSCLHVK